MTKKIFLSLAVFFIAFSLFAQEYALVLSGGGGKGAYQVGVWKALKEYGIAQKTTVISGTSVGALNAALFASESVEKAEKIWINEVPSKLSDEENLISQEGLSLILDMVPIENLSDSQYQVYVTAIRERFKALKFIDTKILGSGFGSHAYYFELNGDSFDEMKSKLLASSAFPLICEPVFVDDGDGGHYYSDGGDENVGGDNVPIKPIIEGYPEIKNIIVVYLSDTKHVSRRIQAKDYDRINLIELFPSIDLDGDTLFESLFDGTANFSESRIRLLIQKGYEDTVDYFQRRKYFPVSGYWFE